MLKKLRILPLLCALVLTGGVPRLAAHETTEDYLEIFEELEAPCEQEEQIPQKDLNALLALRLVLDAHAEEYAFQVHHKEYNQLTRMQKIKLIPRIVAGVARLVVDMTSYGLSNVWEFFQKQEFGVVKRSITCKQRAQLTWAITRYLVGATKNRTLAVGASSAQSCKRAVTHLRSLIFKESEQERIARIAGMLRAQRVKQESQQS